MIGFTHDNRMCWLNPNNIPWQPYDQQRKTGWGCGQRIGRVPVLHCPVIVSSVPASCLPQLNPVSHLTILTPLYIHGKASLQKYIVNLMNKSLDLWYTPTPCHPPIHFDRCSACFYFHGCLQSHNGQIGAETGGSHTLCRVKWPFQFLGHHASTHLWFSQIPFFVSWRVTDKEWLGPKVDLLHV